MLSSKVSIPFFNVEAVVLKMRSDLANVTGFSNIPLDVRIMERNTLGIFFRFLSTKSS